METVQQPPDIPVLHALKQGGLPQQPGIYVHVRPPFVAVATYFSAGHDIIEKIKREEVSHMKNKTYWIAETAVMIALLVALQWATKPLGQFVTGSCVNLVLGVSTLVGGVWCGAVVAIASPFCAFLVGVGPAKLLIVPFIAVGNVVLVLLLHFIAGGKPLGLRSYLAVAAAAVCKFAALFLLVTKVAIPALGLPEAAAATLSASFSWPQLVTAAIGGVIAVTIAPVIRKALKR